MESPNPCSERGFRVTGSFFGTVLTKVPKMLAHEAVLARPPPRLVFVTRGMAPTVKVSINVIPSGPGLAVHAIQGPVKRKGKIPC